MAKLSAQKEEIARFKKVTPGKPNESVSSYEEHFSVRADGKILRKMVSVLQERKSAGYTLKAERVDYGWKHWRQVKVSNLTEACEKIKKYCEDTCS